MGRQKTLGLTFRLFRKAAGKTQKQVSRGLGYSSSQFVSNFERGVSDLPIKQVFIYGQICNVPMETILSLLLGDKVMGIYLDISNDKDLNQKIKNKI